MANLKVIFDPSESEKEVYMYTIGNYQANRPDIVAFDVPRNCVEDVARSINYLSTRTLLPNQTACFEYSKSFNETGKMGFRLIAPSNQKQKFLKKKYLGLMHRKANILLLVPMIPWPTACSSKPLQCFHCGCGNNCTCDKTH